MTHWTVVIIAACVAIVAAVWLRMTLRAAGYRRPDERDGPVPKFWWILPLLPLVVLLVTHALADRANPAVAMSYAASCVPLIALVAIDSDVHRLPDPLTLPLAGAAVVITLIGSASTGDWSATGRALIAGGVLFVAGFVLMIASPGGAGMGFGDVKLLVPLGVLTGWLGWTEVLTTVFAAFLAAGVWAAILLITRRAHRHTAIAFGPFLIGGAIVALLDG